LAEETGDQGKALTLFGDYVTNTWWPRWRDGHPHSAYLYGKRIEKRILPAFGYLRFVDLDADLIGVWKAKMLAEELAPQTINAYLALLSTILNAAVDSDYLPRSPMRRKSQAGRAEAVKKEREPRREVWLTRTQLDRVAAAISPRYRALVLAAALTGLRWGELAALRWDDLQLERPFDDGAVAGPGRLRVVRALSDPGNSGGIRVKGPKTEASKRTIALNQETVDAFLLVGHVGVGVDVGRGDLFVSEPEGDYGDVVAGKQEAHGGGVAQCVHRDGLGSDRRAGRGRDRDVQGEAPFDGVAAHSRPLGSTIQQLHLPRAADTEGRRPRDQAHHPRRPDRGRRHQHAPRRPRRRRGLLPAGRRRLRESLPDRLHQPAPRQSAQVRRQPVQGGTEPS
jgi:hypothetical protein